MSLTVTQPEINLRSELTKNKQRYGIKGKQILESETVEDARSLIGADRKNLIINGGFDVWQRGIIFNSHIGYSADRFYSWSDSKIERTDLVGSQFRTSHGLKITKDTVGASHPYALTVLVENFRQFINNSWTISFWTRSNKITSINVIDMRAENNSGSLGDFDVSFKSLTEPYVTTEWIKKTITLNINDYDISEISQTAHLRLYLLNALNAGTDPLGMNDWVEIAEVQLEKGDQATEFEHRPIAEELALCERYYQKSYNLDVAPSSIDSQGMIHESGVRNNANAIGTTFATTMRTSPTVSLYSNLTGVIGTVSNGTQKNATANYVNENGFSDVTITGATLSDSCSYHYTADAEL